jgi:hypothetical protein
MLLLEIIVLKRLLSPGWNRSQTPVHDLCRFSDATFGKFEAFPDSAARNAHDGGSGRRNFLWSADLDAMLASGAQAVIGDPLYISA